MQRILLVAPWAIAALTFLVLVAAAPATFINGDAVVYASQIRDGNFAERTTHLGYYILAYPIGFLPLPLAYGLNLLNCFLGAGCVLLIALITEAVCRNRLTGVIAALIAATGAHLTTNALHAEVYMAQAFFVLLAIYVWFWERPVFAGAAAAVAFLISSSSLLTLPFFAMMRPKPRDLLWFVGTAGVISAAALLPVLDNYLFGARGMAAAMERGVDYKLAVLKTGQDLFFGFYVFIPVLVAGVVACWRVDEYRKFLWALGVLWLAVFTFGEKFVDVPVQLATYLLASAVAAIGVRAVASGERFSLIAGAILGLAFLAGILLFAPRVPASYADHIPDGVMLVVFGAAMVIFALAPLLMTKWMAAITILTIAVAGNLYLNWDRESKTRATLASLAEAASEISQQRDALVVARWNTLVRLNWLIAEVPYRENAFDLDAIHGDYIDADYQRRYMAALGANRTVYLLEPSRKLEQQLREAGYRQGSVPHIWIRR